MSTFPHEIFAASKEHLLELESDLKENIPAIPSNIALKSNPFTLNVDSETDLIEYINELSCDTVLKEIFDKMPLMEVSNLSLQM